LYVLYNKPGHIVQLDILPGCYVKRLALRILADNISDFAPLQPTDAPAEDSYTLQKQTLLSLRINSEYAFSAGIGWNRGSAGTLIFL
jgi:hypothetical protein